MKKELQDKLFEKYPKLYRQKDLDKTQTAMCWGMSCGSGWYNIIDNLSATIQNRVDYLNGEGQHTYRNLPEGHPRVVCEAVQVKEKYGSLCFYVNHYDENIRTMIDFAEDMSYCTCEKCGAPGKPTTGGWIKIECSRCKGEI